MPYDDIPMYRSAAMPHPYFLVTVDTSAARAFLDRLIGPTGGDFTEVKIGGDDASLYIVFRPGEISEGVLVRRSPEAGKVCPIVAALADAMIDQVALGEANMGMLAHAALALRAALGEHRPDEDGMETLAGGLATWRLDRAIAYMEERMHLSITTTSVAQACGLTVNHFSRAFARTTGQPPHRWLMGRRVERAQRLLRDSDRPLGDIAAACGFSEAGHLSRVFARLVGVPPGTWRRWALKTLPSA
ncbi:MAG: HTH-type transcriptional activator Btr [Luteibacter sp.]|uniref:AraC family transcriptional regulator n=1 Tax=Luteibacter sp. TaxID=1886636 RepID=UPI00137F3FBE|nr:AraC family transcriptional regulator [Luteibacter sp.]KAF1008321.1 MAG: HTH-type transcriptional activator Btr [Luteibacter sp.]